MSTLTNEQKNAVDELRTKYGLRRIAEELGLSYGQVRYYVEHYEPPTRTAYVNAAPLQFGVKVWDLETTDLNTFFGRLIVAAFLDINTMEVQKRNLYDFEGDEREKERQLLQWTWEQLEEGDVFIGHNTLAFDSNFLNGRFAIHGMDLITPPRLHIDTYQVARYGFKGRTQGYSLENLLDFFQVSVQKDKPSKHEWSDSVILDRYALERITDRCVADVEGTALLWPFLRPYYYRWRGRG